MKREFAPQTSSHMPHSRVCARILRRGSKSFAAASLLLPKHLRKPASAIYAFCREADDAVDLSSDKRYALAKLNQRLTAIYQDKNLTYPVDRALAHVVHTHGVPRSLFEALLEGFAWDVDHRQYTTISDLHAYAARVAGTVGVMLTHLMGEHRKEVLARAGDLGIAMQLTNIARDVGEDAREQRIYLPIEWLVEAGVDVSTWLQKPHYNQAIASVVCRLLEHAHSLYQRAQLGIAYLPADCRMAIFAAQLIYADIGRCIASHAYNSIDYRAVVPWWRKVVLLGKALQARWFVTHPIAHLGEAPAHFLLTTAYKEPC